MNNKPRKGVSVGANGARRNLNRIREKLVKSTAPDDKIKFPLTEERDQKIDASREKDIMARKYLDWEKDFINRPKTVGQVIDGLLDLSNMVADTIKSSPDLLKSTQDIIFGKIAQWNDLDNIVKSATVSVSGRCQCGKMLKPKEPVPLKVWLYKAFDITCECGEKTPATKCKATQNLPPAAAKSSAAPTSKRSTRSA